MKDSGEHVITDTNTNNCGKECASASARDNADTNTKHCGKECAAASVTDSAKHVITDTNTNNGDKKRTSASATDNARTSENVASTITPKERTFISSTETDIGYHINSENLNDFALAALLERHWIPPVNYEFPHNIVRKKEKILKSKLRGLI